jgi:hypothetical protein
MYGHVAMILGCLTLSQPPHASPWLLCSQIRVHDSLTKVPSFLPEPGPSGFFLPELGGWGQQNVPQSW